MSIRIVCFALALVSDGVWRWVFVVGALLIPYFAVVYANGGREPNEEPPETLHGHHSRELPNSPA